MALKIILIDLYFHTLFFFQGHTLFQTHDNLEHLAMMTRIIGDIPAHMIRRTKTSFYRSGRLTWDWSAPAARYASQHCRSLGQYRRSGPGSLQGQEETLMLDLVARMLDYDPAARLALQQALKHPFLDRSNNNTGGYSISPSAVGCKVEEVSKHILRLQIWEQLCENKYHMPTSVNFYNLCKINYNK